MVNYVISAKKPGRKRFSRVPFQIPYTERKFAEMALKRFKRETGIFPKGSKFKVVKFK